MTSSAQVRLPKYHPAQRQIVQNARRFNVVCAGRRTGKTKMGTRLLVEPALEGHPVAWMAPSYKLLLEVWREVVAACAEVATAKDSQQHRLQLITGGVIDMWTLDGPDPARGRKYKRVIVDEAAMVRDLKHKWQAAVRPTLTDFQGDAWFLSTPKGMNDFHDLAELGKDPQHPDWAFFHFPTSANPYINPAEIEAARAELPEIVFMQEYLAQFVSGEGARVKPGWLKVADPPPGLTLTMGVDLAISERQDADYTAAVILGTDPQGNVYIMHAERTRASFHQVLEFIKRLAAQWNPGVIAVEQVQFQAAVIQELLRTTRLPVRGIRPDKDKVTRFLPLEARYERGLVYHAPTLPREYERELLSFPLGDHDDLVDAAAHAFAMQATPAPKLKSHVWHV